MAKQAAGLVVFRKLEESIEYLVLKASYGSEHWSPPKGHIDPGDSSWETALRETREEAGLAEKDMEIYKDISKTLYYPVKGKRKEVFYWLAKLIDPKYKITLSDEHTDFKWLDLSETVKILGHDNYIRMYEEFHEHAKKLTC